MVMYTNLQDFYRGKPWENFTNILAQERTDKDGILWCARCGKPIVRKYDRIGHHCKVHLTLANVNDVTIALNPDNVEFVHHRCHNEMHERFGFAALRPKRVYIVHGSPCSGKSTFAASVAGPADIIMDMDAIWTCISASGLSNDGSIHAGHEPRLKNNVFQVRNCILDMIRTRYGEWDNAYIIGSYPRQSDRERMAAIYGAEMVHIDTAREVCMQRASERPGEWLGYIEEYWNSYTPQGVEE